MSMGWVGGIVAANMMCIDHEYPKNIPQGRSAAEIMLDSELVEFHTLEEKRNHLLKRMFINDKIISHKIIPHHLVESYLFNIERDLEIKQAEEHEKEKKKFTGKYPRII